MCCLASGKSPDKKLTRKLMVLTIKSRHTAKHGQCIQLERWLLAFQLAAEPLVQVPHHGGFKSLE